MPITVAFATFHFKHSLKMIGNRYQFKNYMIIHNLLHFLHQLI